MVNKDREICTADGQGNSAPKDSPRRSTKGPSSKTLCYDIYLRFFTVFGPRTSSQVYTRYVLRVYIYFRVYRRFCLLQVVSSRCRSAKYLAPPDVLVECPLDPFEHTTGGSLDASLRGQHAPVGVRTLQGFNATVFSDVYTQYPVVLIALSDNIATLR